MVNILGEPLYIVSVVVQKYFVDMYLILDDYGVPPLSTRLLMRHLNHTWWTREEKQLPRFLDDATLIKE